MNPTVCYITARKRSRFEEWFLPAIAARVLPDENPLVIKIDRFAEEPSTFDHGPITVRVEPPKPCVWSGPHRLTDRDWFSASSYRNTALCLCPTPYIAYCDDLSIPDPQWWQAAKDATCFAATVTCGLYSKIRDVVVEDGVVASFTASPLDEDIRLRRIGARSQGSCVGGLFGCSLVAPVETLLSVGGWPEYADGMSYEDRLLSEMLRNRGVKFRFDRRLFTYEDEQAHFEEEPMTRRDKGVSPKDKSHAALAMAKGLDYFENYYPGGTRALREHVLAGNPFPAPTGPLQDWYDGQPISEMVPS